MGSGSEFCGGGDEMVDFSRVLGIGVVKAMKKSRFEECIQE